MLRYLAGCLTGAAAILLAAALALRHLDHRNRR